MRLLVVLLLFSAPLLAQDKVSCKVEMKNISGTYQGDCKNGYAHGKGDATGMHHYVGEFKNGLPNGKGTYYYSDSMYHAGIFQDGIKEGKGETHYVRMGMQDSLVKGYWSADEYRGKNYQTYIFSGESLFDQTEIRPSAESGNTITFEISTTTGAPDGTVKSTTGGAGFILTLTELVADDDKIVQQVQTYSSTSKFSITYTISSFPVKLQATLSNGRSFDLELFKAAKWTARLYMNK